MNNKNVKYPKIYIGSSDISILTMRGTSITKKEEMDIPLQFESDGSYLAYIINDSDVEINAPYEPIAEFKNHMDIYDDAGLVRQFSANFINVYRTGEKDCIIQLFNTPKLEEIDKNSINPGDIVYIKRPVFLNQNEPFRYCKLVSAKVIKISDNRDKISLEITRDHYTTTSILLMKDAIFYKQNDDSAYETELAENMEKLMTTLCAINNTGVFQDYGKLSKIKDKNIQIALDNAISLLNIIS